jgi:hypothetical protein
VTCMLCCAKLCPDILQRSELSTNSGGHKEAHRCWLHQDSTKDGSCTLGRMVNLFGYKLDHRNQ